MASKTIQAPASATLLVELLTEELPPKALLRLAETFRDALAASLEGAGLSPRPHAVAPRCLATPRRLVVLIGGALDKAADVNKESAGPSVSAGPDAAKGFARKCGVAVESLVKHQTAKGEVWLARYTVAGAKLDDLLAQKVDEALKKLPIPKLMRWGDGEAQFARPVHGLVMMRGSHVVAGSILGCESGNQTLGHRFLSGGRITIRSADSYEQTLLKSGKVIADFAARRSEIVNKIQYLCGNSRVPVASDALYDEITALVEAPTAYEGTFGAEFLEVPQECLILSMQQQQKYVPLRDRKTGKLLPCFLFVSNIETKQPREIIHGNERVLRARLSDAKFFYDQDRRTRLEARVPRLASVVYHRKLGNQLERVERIQLLAGRIARAIGAGPLLAERAAWLAKADLLTDMVGEFPELQGIMGRYYALHDGEPHAVADAIGDQYKLKLDESDPENLVSASLYVADRIEQLTGLFGIGERPTGDKDPYALRRAALGLINAFELLGTARRLTGGAVTDVREFLEFAAGLYPKGTLAPDTVTAVHAFILERYWNQLATIFAKDAVEAVLSQKPPLMDVVPRVQAVEEFRRLPEAESLASATKRARNILRKEGVSGVHPAKPDLLIEEAEKALSAAIAEIRSKVDAHFERRQFLECLKTLAGVRAQVDAFFDKVLVNAEDRQVRENRLALLSELDYLFNRVADISKLAA